MFFVNLFFTADVMKIFKIKVNLLTEDIKGQKNLKIRNNIRMNLPHIIQIYNFYSDDMFFVIFQKQRISVCFIKVEVSFYK